VDKAGLQGFYLTSIILGIREGIMKMQNKFWEYQIKNIGIKNDLCLVLHIKKEWNVDTCWRIYL